MKRTLSRAIVLLVLLITVVQSTFADPLTLQITPGRSSHTFGIMEPGSYPSYIGTGQFIFNLDPLNDGGWLELQTEWGFEQPFDLFDYTTGETLSGAGLGTDIRNGAWIGPFASTVSFMVPWEMHNRQFAVAQLPNLFYVANPLSWQFTPNSTLNWGPQFELSSTVDPTRPFRLIDVTNSMQAQVGRTNLINAQWEPAEPPMLEVTFYLDNKNFGAAF